MLYNPHYSDTQLLAVNCKTVLSFGVNCLSGLLITIMMRISTLVVRVLGSFKGFMLKKGKRKLLEKSENVSFGEPFTFSGCCDITEPNDSRIMRVSIFISTGFHCRTLEVGSVTLHTPYPRHEQSCKELLIQLNYYGQGEVDRCPYKPPCSMNL